MPWSFRSIRAPAGPTAGLSTTGNAALTDEELDLVKAWITDACADADEDGLTPHHHVVRWLSCHDSADADEIMAYIRRRGQIGPLAATEGLLLAVFNDRRDLAAFFLDCGAYVEGIDPVVDAALVKDVPLQMACVGGNIDIVRLLVERGADVHRRNYMGKSTLHMACENGNADIVEFLATNGADVNATMDNGQSPVLQACSRGFADVARVLLRFGAEVASSDFNDLLRTTAWSGSVETAQLVIQYCMPLEGTSSDDETDNGDDDNAITAALFLAANFGLLDMTRWLYNYAGANERIRANRTGSLLGVACKSRSKLWTFCWTKDANKAIRRTC
ncbi:ankyrin repeat-containing domain protein [Zopfochytrium polystomum]|nr:ankyrin repeat-containing domain protein [Zopfochytrium polystomum]